MWVKTGGVSEAEAVGPRQATAAECGPGREQGHAGWFWGEPSDGLPEDAPLHVLLLAASRIMGTFYAGTLAQSGLRVSPAGLGVLRVLLAGDGLKSSDVAARGWSSPATLPPGVNTLVREGYVGRRPDPGDRGGGRLYRAAKGRPIGEEMLIAAGPHRRA